MTDNFTRQPPFFSIITPSYNMLSYLRACCNSVHDQDVILEHIIMDGASTDGTDGWLLSKSDIVSVSEKDDGMYDAINKGVSVSNGEIIAYLNCDEQYLVGALKKVQDFFLANSSVDVLFGNTLLIQPNGKLLAFRKGFIPRWPYIWASHMYVHSSSMFVRKKVFEAGFMFDKNWKMIGDADFVVSVLRGGFIVRHINEYLSAFIITSSNLGESGYARTELMEFRNKAPWWLRRSSFITDALIRIEKLWSGAYWEKMPLSYSVYTVNDLSSRTNFVKTSASPLYPRKG